MISARRLAALVVAGAALVGCEPSPSQAVASLEALFPVLERLRVESYLVIERCEYIAYARGAFVTDPASSDCEVDVEGPYPRQPFDDRARADIDLIRQESDRHGQPLQHAYLTYAANGTITDDSWLGFRLCLSYVYDPGYASPRTPRWSTRSSTRTGTRRTRAVSASS